ncbi:MAG: hypothetical protein VKL39_14270, partial [Leptolyngbyaceae bacterium]|nr:hypothetical protein [Leptolyngbyaceae bacterium]
MNHQTDSLQEDKATSHEHTLEAGQSTVSPPVTSTVATSESSHTAPENATPEAGDNHELSRQVPIPPASEPKQYRAIGLIYGKYIPSEEQFTRGNLQTENGTLIDSVLLGRVMSLVKKHIDLEKAHLWVVYPRTRNKDQYLHAQIVGVWEPEKLNRPLDEANGDEREVHEDASDVTETSPEDSASSSEFSPESQPESQNGEIAPEKDVPDSEKVDAAAVDAAANEGEPSTSGADDNNAPVSDVASQSAISSTEKTESEAVESEALASETNEAEQKEAEAELKKPFRPAPFAADDQNMLKDGYFSIRGEVVKASEEDGEVTVKIRQAPRKGTTQQRSFNVVLKGSLEGRVTGYFWDLNVQRDGTDLVIQDGTMIGIVLPKKRSKNAPNSRG